MRQRLLAGVFVASVGVGFAGTASANEPEVYERAYFAQFGVQNASDMVGQIPGFTVRGGEGGERGFGQASLNILINGRRPSSKSLGADAILERISVDRVVRIEVVDGTSLDIPGLSGDVANIITESVGVTGNWQIGARFEEGTEPQLFDGETSVSLSRGDVTVTLSADFGQFTRSEDGVEQFFDADDVLFQDRRERTVFELQDPALDGALNWEQPNGNVLNLTASLGVQNRNFDLRDFVLGEGETEPTAGSDQTLFFEGEDEIELELGADYEFGLGGPGTDKRLKLIGLYRYEDSEFTNRVGAFAANAAPIRQEFLQDLEETEIIGRSELSWDGGNWQLSGEYAFNRLDAASEFNGAEQPFVQVEEDRLQGALTHNRRLGDWDVQANLGAEYSEISVPSNAESEARSFIRPKGFVTGSRDFGDDYTLTLRGERTVGQLNFFDFVDDVDLDEGRDDTGNTNLVPNQLWRAEAALEHSNPTGVSWRLSADAAIVEDPIDRIRFADGSEGVGNLDSNAYFYGVQGNFTWVMDDLVKGMRLQGRGSLSDTDLEDPLTGDRRRFNGSALYFWDLELRHDIPNTDWAYEIELDRTGDVEAFRFDRQLAQGFDSPSFSAEIEHKDVFGMNLRIVLQNIFDTEQERETLLFEGDRFGSLIRRENRRRTRGRRLGIVLSDTF